MNARWPAAVRASNLIPNVRNSMSVAKPAATFRAKHLTDHAHESIDIGSQNTGSSGHSSGSSEIKSVQPTGSAFPSRTQRHTNLFNTDIASPAEQGDP